MLLMIWTVTKLNTVECCQLSSYFVVLHRCVCLLYYWYGMVWYGMVWYGMVWYGTVWFGIYGVVWHGMVWYGMLYGLELYGVL